MKSKALISSCLGEIVPKASESRTNGKTCSYYNHPLVFIHFSFFLVDDTVVFQTPTITIFYLPAIHHLPPHCHVHQKLNFKEKIDGIIKWINGIYEMLYLGKFYSIVCMPRTVPIFVSTKLFSSFLFFFFSCAPFMRKIRGNGNRQQTSGEPRDVKDMRSDNLIIKKRKKKSIAGGIATIGDGEVQNFN